ncbi:MAG: hypothetical protein BGO23_05600 [Solirubrobacterales bacterium 67-14]|nr:MAG: hypothetical protein BGO23_05600 [Solirubrobacterales bacterium 67-14]
MAHPAAGHQQEGHADRHPAEHLGHGAPLESRDQQAVNRGDRHHPAGDPEQQRHDPAGPVAEQHDRDGADPGGDRGTAG